VKFSDRVEIVDHGGVVGGGDEPRQVSAEMLFPKRDHGVRERERVQARGHRFLVTALPRDEVTLRRVGGEELVVHGVYQGRDERGR
jgi:hypothetical protein